MRTTSIELCSAPNLKYLWAPTRQRPVAGLMSVMSTPMTHLDDLAGRVALVTRAAVPAIGRTGGAPAERFQDGHHCLRRMRTAGHPFYSSSAEITPDTLKAVWPLCRRATHSSASMCNLRITSLQSSRVRIISSTDATQATAEAEGLTKGLLVQSVSLVAPATSTSGAA